MVEPVSRARLLVIVSGDYGELGAALYFLQGLDLATAPRILLPVSLRHALGDAPGWRVASYESLTDIRRHLDAEPLDAVLLFSGYLLTIGKTFSVLGSLALFRILARRSLPVITTDPFIGLMDSPGALDFTAVLDQHGWALARRFRSSLVAARLRLLQVQLRRCWHIYPSPIERLQAARNAPRSLCYFNPATQWPQLQRPATQRPRWIFVLSEIDWTMQRRTGSARFLAALVARLREVIALQRHAVLVAPAALLDAVGSAMPHPELTLLHSAGYLEFMPALLDAEYAFFWNYYSFSIIHRVLRQQPVMFFGEGHMVRIVPAIADEGIRFYYHGWRPPLLSLDDVLDAAVLADRAAEASSQFLRIGRGLQACDTPAALLAKIITGPGVG